MKLPLKSGMFSQNLNKTIKFLPEVRITLDLHILHKKLGGIFTVLKIKGNLKTQRNYDNSFSLAS